MCIICILYTVPPPPPHLKHMFWGYSLHHIHTHTADKSVLFLPYQQLHSLLLHVGLLVCSGRWFVIVHQLIPCPQGEFYLTLHVFTISKKEVVHVNMIYGYSDKMMKMVDSTLCLHSMREVRQCIH